MTSADILKLIKEKDVKYVDVRFTDVRGKMQHVTFDIDLVDEDFLENPSRGDVLRRRYRRAAGAIVGTVDDAPEVFIEVPPRFRLIEKEEEVAAGREAGGQGGVDLREVDLGEEGERAAFANGPRDVSGEIGPAAKFAKTAARGRDKVNGGLDEGGATFNEFALDRLKIGFRLGFAGFTPRFQFADDLKVALTEEFAAAGIVGTGAGHEGRGGSTRAAAEEDGRGEEGKECQQAEGDEEDGG